MEKAHTSDIYDDVELTCPDEKVCNKLCVEGPCKCSILEDCGLTYAFILEHVVPNIRTGLLDSSAKVLCRAIRWLIMSPGGDLVPQSTRQRVKTAFASVLIGEDENLNPIKKVVVIITCNERAA